MEIELTTPRSPTEFDEYFAMRWRILRAPWQQERGSERDEFEDIADHVCARDSKGRLIGVGRIHQVDSTVAQIRYMAVDDACRSSGVGSAILARLESLASKRGATRIFLNARESAVPFYAAKGYAATAPGPTLFGVIRHTRMVKTIG